MIEALLLLPLLILAFLAAAWMGKLQFAAQAMVQTSRQVAMSAAAGAPVAELEARGTREVRIRSLANASGAELSAEWLDTPAHLISVTVRAPVTGMGPWDTVQVKRRISVAAGAGNAQSDKDAHRRIGVATMAWRRAAERSRSLASDLSGPMGVVDTPWRRPALSLDWLSSWADLVPADRLAQDGSAGQ